MRDCKLSHLQFPATPWLDALARSTKVDLIIFCKALHADKTTFAGKLVARLAPRFFYLVTVLGSLFLVSAASLNWAQNRPSPDLTEASLEELMSIKVETVYGASKHLQKVTDAPASITIVTSEEIRRFGYRTLGDILRSVPGFYVTYDRNYTYVAVRGFGRTGDYNSRILLLVDGHRTNDNVYGGALLGTEFPIDVDLIDRVEIIHGPSSSIYGNSAFFGVINIITKRGSVAKGLQVATAGASYDTGSARITYGGKFKPGWEALLSGSFYDSHGQRALFFQEFNTPETNQGIFLNGDHDKVHQFFANLSYKELHLQAVYGSREKGIPTASFGTVFNDSRAQTIDRLGYVELGYEHKYRKDWVVAGRVYFDNYTYDGIYPFNYSPGTGSQVTLNYDFANGAWWGEEISISKPLLTKHMATVGEEYRDNFRQKQGNFDINPFLVYLDDRRSSVVSALYAQDEYTIRKNLLLNAGVRYNRNYTFGATTNPRLGLIYSPLEKTTLKVLYGSAFRAPNAYESYYQSTFSQSNLKLQPETIHTLEFEVEQYVGNRYRLSGGIFQNRVDSLINQVTLPSGFLQFENQGSVLAKGAELVFERKWASGMGAQFNYTYEHALDRPTRTVLANTPAHLANANLLLPLFSKKLLAGLDVHYISSRRTLLGNTASGFVMMNLTLFSQRVFKRWELSGSIYNLLNTRYGYPGGEEHREDIIYQDGRNARLKLAYTFGGRRG